MRSGFSVDCRHAAPFLRAFCIRRPKRYTRLRLIRMHHKLEGRIRTAMPSATKMLHNGPPMLLQIEPYAYARTSQHTQIQIKAWWMWKRTLFSSVPFLFVCVCFFFLLMFEKYRFLTLLQLGGCCFFLGIQWHVRCAYSLHRSMYYMDLALGIFHLLLYTRSTLCLCARFGVWFLACTHVVWRCDI